MTESVARVYLLDVPYHIDRPYDYFIPIDLRGTLRVGGFAVVPFGGSNRKSLALVAELSIASEYTKLKPILLPACPGIVLDEEALGLCLYMKKHFFCTVGDAVKAMIPQAALTKLKNHYRVAKPLSECDLTAKQEMVYHYLEENGPMEGMAIAKKLGPYVLAILALLATNGVLAREFVYTDSAGKHREYAELAERYLQSAEEDLVGQVRGEKQRKLLSLLCHYGRIDLADLREEYGIQKSVVTALAERGLVKLIRDTVFRDPYRGKIPPEIKRPVLSEEQEAAKEQILALCRTGEPKAALLHGVTGSGKTNVIRAVMDEVIAAGKSVILLVPEIALTPQTVGIFRACYGDRTVVIHSALSQGERWDAWRKIRNGEADVCIGTRSAVFAPFSNLGLIVLDEEQEHTYKSEMEPRYHARDIARYRCAAQKATMLLASATPSLESYARAEEGKYTLVKLTKRYGNAVLPETVIADMRAEAGAGHFSPVGSQLKLKLTGILERKEQAILFINQRGYNRFLSCPLCGNVLMCPHCSVSYTYHTVPGRGTGYLFCHYCGSKAPVPERCGLCGNGVLKRSGYGTQMVEEELHSLFPEARVMRMDADTTSGRFSYDEMLGKFRRGEADILLGTQMVTKGHDFPGVTLVGVIGADSSLYLSDYKANERTFGLLTQVIGRAGRGEKPGCALIQTYNPGHPVIGLSSEQDYEKMYRSEIALRRSLLFPPFCDIAVFSLFSPAENELVTGAGFLYDACQTLIKGKYADLPTAVFGPMEAPLYRIGDVYRMELIIKCKAGTRTLAMLAELYEEIGRKIGKRIRISLDMNPNSL